MKVSIVTRVRIGFSIAIFTLLVIAELIAVTGVDIRQRSGVIICLGLGLAGLIVWATGGLGKAKPTEPNMGQETLAGQPAEHPLASFRSRRFWGVILMLSAVTLACTSAYRYEVPKAKPIPAKRKPVVTVPPPKPVVTLAPSNPPVTFPPLKLAGIILHGAHSSALINGRVLLVGERIGDVRLIAVDAQHATVELEGETNVLSLSK